MADLARIKRNVGKMVGQDAPEADIDEYIKSEGVSLDQVRSFKEGGPSPEVAKEAEFRRKVGAGGMPMRVADSATFGAAIPISAALEAGSKTIFNALSGKPTDFVGDYKHSRDVQDLILKQSRDEGGVGGHISEFVLSVPFFGGKGRTAIEAASQGPKQLAPPAGNYLGQLWDASKAGALYGGIYGLNSARGGVGEHVENALTHGAVGAVAAPALKGGIDATLAASRMPGNAWRWATSRTPGQVAQTEAAAADFAESGVREFGPAITPSGTQRRTAEGLAGSIFGAPLRREAAGAIDDAARAVQYSIRDPIGNQPVNDAAADVQNALRRNLTQRSIPSETVERMTPEELARLTGPIDERGFSPIPPNIPPVAPRYPPPVMPEPINPSTLKFDTVQPGSVARGEVRPNYPAREAMDVPQGVREAVAQRQHDAAVARREVDEAWDAYASLSRKMGRDPTSKTPLTSMSDMPLVAAMGRVDKANAEHVRAVRALKEAQASADEAQHQAWVAASRQEHLRASRQVEDEYQRASSAEAARARDATEANRTAAMRQAEVDARARAAEANATARARAEEEASAATQRARDEAARKFEEDRASRPGFEVGRSREPYKTEFDAAYEQLDRMGKFARNPMGERIEGFTETATEGLLGKMALELRAAGKLPGYRGKFYSENVTKDGIALAPRADLMQHLRGRFGNEIADRLETLIERRAKAQLGFSPQGIRDLITTVRRERQKATRPIDPMSSPDPDKAAALTRLEGALKKDFEQFIREGPGGERVVGMTKNVDAQYANFINEFRKPLAKLFGEKVEPLQAMNHLAKAAEDGNLTILRPYMRVMAEKADPQKGAATLLAHMTSNAASLQDFVKGYQSINPAAKAVIFAGDKGQAMQRSLERLVRVSERLAPFEKALKGGAVDLTNRANITVGLTALAHVFPAMMMSAGAIATTRFMASPRYAEWLVRTAQARTPKQLDLAYGQLATMLGRDSSLEKDTRQKIMGVVAELAGSKDANAIYIGENAKGIDKAELSMAKAATAAGQPEKDVWSEHGWKQQPDGKWRGEIDDSGASLSDLATRMTQPGAPLWKGMTTVGSLIRHPKLFKAYPQLADMAVGFSDGPLFGSYSPEDNQITLTRKSLENPEVLMQTLVHELQHRIQKDEKFAYGLKADPFKYPDIYARSPGEAEASDAEARLSMSAEDRRKTLPLSSVNRELNWNNARTIDGRPVSRRPPGMMRLGGPKEAEDELPQQALDQYADAIAQAANAGGLDVRRAKPQEVIDAAWKQSPTDGMADAIEFIAKRHGLKLPWE